MEIRNINTCINCENLLSNFMCQKHKQTVQITNSCESHVYRDSITKDSSCSNCFHFGKTSCSKPGEASKDMLCFDWQKS
tara:strand:+ start:740 stop:976 length:237 start_codon:yes stop_codon:yes gene_type:complete